MKRYVGIDPGLNGAIAVLVINSISAQVSWDIYDMPTLKEGKRSVVDPVGLHRILDDIHTCDSSVTVLVEKVGGLPGQSAPAAFNFGKGYGMIIGMLAALWLRYELVTPQRWKKTIMEGQAKDKDAARLLAMRLWPGSSHRLRLKKHDGRAEAMLLAEYGRRMNL